MERAFLSAELSAAENPVPLAASRSWSAFLSENPVQPETTALERRGKSRQKPGEMSDFCLPTGSKLWCVDLKVEQNLEITGTSQKSPFCSQPNSDAVIE